MDISRFIFQKDSQAAKTPADPCFSYFYPYAMIHRAYFIFRMSACLHPEPVPAPTSFRGVFSGTARRMRTQCRVSIQAGCAVVKVREWENDGFFHAYAWPAGSPAEK